MREPFNNCVAVIGSMTLTMRAQAVLANAAIRAETVKADSAKVKRGCAYGLLIPCAAAETVREILRNAGVHIQTVYPEER